MKIQVEDGIQSVNKYKRNEIWKKQSPSWEEIEKSKNDNDVRVQEAISSSQVEFPN